MVKRTLVARNLVRMEDHLGLAYMVMGWMCRSTAERDEVWSDVLYGLFHAARYWDPKVGEFSTYATACMRRRVERWRLEERRFRYRRGEHRGTPWGRGLRLFSEMGESYVGGNADLFAYTPKDEAIEGTSELYIRLVQALDTLPERMNRILRMRVGLIKSRRSYTLDEVGRHFGVTRERIRSLESAALEKLRKRDYAQHQTLKALFDSLD